MQQVKPPANEAISHFAPWGEPRLHAHHASCARWFASYKPEAGAFAEALERLAPGRASLLDAVTLAKLGSSDRVSPPAAPEALVLWSALDSEQQACAQRHKAAQALLPKVSAVVKDTLEHLVFFLGSESAIPKGFSLALERVLTGWAHQLQAPPEEARFQLACLWVHEVLANFSAPHQEWRFCLACLEQAFYRQVGADLGRILHIHWEGLANATARFDLARAVFADFAELARELGTWPFDCQQLLVAALAESLLEVAAPPACWPLCSAVFLYDKPYDIDAEGLANFKNQLSRACRERMERNWLDLLLRPLERLQLALAHLQWRTQHRAEIQSLVTATASSLREALESFRKNPAAESDLFMLLEACFAYRLSGSSPSASQSALRQWLGACFATFPAASWQQPKAVLAALKTQILQRSLVELRNLEAHFDLCEQFLSDFRASLKLGRDWLDGDLEQRAWSMWLVHGSSCAAALKTLAGGSAGAIEKLTLKCPLEAAKNVLQASLPRIRQAALGQRLWGLAEPMARSTAEYAYRLLPEYATQTNGEKGMSKCVRDNSFTLRRVALAWDLGVEDPGSFVADWWNWVVNACLVTRPPHIFSVNLDGLLEAARTHLDVDDQVALEAVLRPIYEGAGGDKVVQSPVQWSYPAEGRLGEFATFPIHDHHLDSAEAFAKVHLSQSERNLFKDLLQRGWSNYLWQGFLDPHACKHWQTFPQGKNLEGLLIGLFLEPVEASEARQWQRLDYIQALIHFARQLQVGPFFRHQGEQLAQVIHDPQVRPMVADWLKIAGERMQRLSFPFWCWEADRRWLELLSLRPNLDLRQVVTQLNQVLNDQALRVTYRWLNPLFGSQHRLAAYARVAASYCHSEDPLFSPNPLEEEQWRQSLSLLLVSCARPWGPDSEVVFLSLATSQKIFQDRNFSQKLQRVQSLLSAKEPQLQLILSDRFERLGHFVAKGLELSHCGRNLSALASGLGPNWQAPPWQAWTLGLIRQGLTSSLSCSHWPLSGSLRLLPDEDWLKWPQAGDWQQSWRRLAPQALEQVPQRHQAPPVPRFSPHPQGLDSCQRDLVWLQRRLLLAGDSLLWYGQEIHPLVGSTPASHCWEKLKEVACLEFLTLALPAFHSPEPALALLAEEGRERAPLWFESQVRSENWISISHLQEVNRKLSQPISEEALSDFIDLLAGGGANLLRSTSWSSKSAWQAQKLLQQAPASQWSHLIQGLQSQVQEQPLALGRLVEVEELEKLRHLLHGGELARHLSRIAGERQTESATWLKLWAEVLLLTPPDLLLVNSALVWTGRFSNLEGWKQLWANYQDWVEAAKLPLGASRLWEQLSRSLQGMIPALLQAAPLLERLSGPTSPLHFPQASSLEQKQLVTFLLLLPAVQEQSQEQAQKLRQLLSQGWCSSIEDPQAYIDGLLDFLRDEFLDLDLAPLQRHWGLFVDLLKSERAAQAAQAEMSQLATTLSQKLPALAGQPLESLQQLLTSLAFFHRLGGSQSCWQLPPLLGSVPEGLLSHLTGLPEGEKDKLQAALHNVMARLRLDGTAALMELGRCLEITQRMGELQGQWRKASELAFPASPSLAQGLLRRLAVEAWIGGRPCSGQGSLAWIRAMSLEWTEAELNPRQFLKLNRDLLTLAKQQKVMHESTVRVADEFFRALERRLDGTSGSLWELLHRPVLDSEAAQKPQKRSIWGRLTESFEGLVGGR